MENNENIKKSGLQIKVINKTKKVLAKCEGSKEAQLFYEAAYEEDDIICIEIDGKEGYFVIQLDEALGAALVYLKTDTFIYTIPFGEKRCNISPKVFNGEAHLISVRRAREDEIKAYRNLAMNVMDQHGETNCYPHATANVETRGESVFAARNAIDGVTVNWSHGPWPFASWGINQQDDAVLCIEFGRMVEVDEVVLYTRADFPHDNWWEKVKLSFSDDSEIIWEMEKSALPHRMKFEAKKIEWVKLSELIKANDPSPFPALSQIQVYGREVEE